VDRISTNSYWPITSHEVRWRGVDIWIMPIMKGFYPAVALMAPPGKSRAECEELLMRFLSMLSWVEERGFMVEGGRLSGGNLPRPMGRDKERGFSICDEFDLSYFPEVTDATAMRALALMREGRGLNHVGYAFLSFYKILETALPKDVERIAWISASIAGLTGFGVKEALGGIRAQGTTTPEDIGKHLYESGRCAMAHANREPIIDPDKPGDLRRLGSELPIVRAPAVKAIEEVFGVEASRTNFRKHLYELDGFKKILGSDIVAHMQNGTAPAGQPSRTSASASAAKIITRRSKVCAASTPATPASCFTRTSSRSRATSCSGSRSTSVPSASSSTPSATSAFATPALLSRPSGP
jgi:Methylamine utilization protein MauJ